MPNEFTEERHFSLLKKHLELSDGINYTKTESPDFLFQYSGKLIGLEHTEIFIEKEYPLQAIESIQDDISLLAQEYADSNSYIPSRTKILFGDVRGLKKNERKVLARNIAGFVQFNLLTTPKVSYTQIRLEPNVKEVNTIYSSIMPPGFENHYFAARSGWVKPDATEEAHLSIRKKAKKIEQYRSKCEEIWLLIVADGRNPSSLLGKGEGVAPIKSLHGFDRVFFMFFITKYIQEVEVLQSH